MGLTTTSFTVFTLISGFTNVRIMTLQYLAVDRSFPYHLNVFNDIPVNYSGPSLSNISNSNTGQRTYTNTINYTLLSNTIGSSHITFGSNLASNYVALYLCGIQTRANGTTSQEVKFSVTTTVISIDQFKI